MNDGLLTLVLALSLVTTVLIFWRVMLFIVALTFVSVFMVGLLQVAQWVQSLS